MSSLVRRIEIRIMRSMNVKKTRKIPGRGTMAYPSLIPAVFRDTFKEKK